MKANSPVRRKRVSISFNPKNGRLVVRPKTVALNAKQREEILWRCRDANLEIKIEAVNPPFKIARWRCSKGGGILSGIPKKKRRQKDQCFKYTVKVLDSVNGKSSNGVNSKGTKKSKNTEESAQAQNCHRPVVREAFLLLQ
ncbi:MAG TPA: hypothetical protein VEF04_15440 [Blastocatellia bacterium]|nr:hypothetical protein [Blastocatellia bacterium]